MSAVWRANTCCIASESVCKTQMNLTRNQWVDSMFKADEGSQFKREQGITEAGVPRVEIEALRKFKDTGLVPKLYAQVDQQVLGFSPPHDCDGADRG